jgi:hypothetical protein
MQSSATGGHLYYVLRSRLEPTTYKPGITSSMGRCLRQHGGQERWEVVGVFDLGSRKAYMVEQLVLQRFSHCRLNASGEYLKLSDGEMEELLKAVGEATSKRYEPKAEKAEAPPEPQQHEPGPTNRTESEEREMWRARSPYNNSNSAASPPPSKPETSKRSAASTPPTPSAQQGFKRKTSEEAAAQAKPLDPAFIAGTCLAALAGWLALVWGNLSSPPTPNTQAITQSPPTPQIAAQPPPREDIKSPNDEELRTQEIIRKGDEAEVWAFRNRSWCDMPITGGWKVTGPMPHANGAALCREAAGRLYELRKLRAEQEKKAAPQTLAEDLAQPLTDN